MTAKSGAPQFLGLLGWLTASAVAAAVGGAATAQAGPFYTDLIRPDWSPPPAVFGPVWTVLFAMMAVAAWLVWRAKGFGSARTALTLFIVQLAANALWSWVFFAWQRGALAFAEIILLWLLIAATIVAFWRIRPVAGALLIPYLLWVTFAGALNYTLWQLNPRVLG